MKHIFTLSYVQTRILALVPRFGLVLVAQVKGFGSRRTRSGQIFEIFGILGGAGDTNNSTSMNNYQYEPYRHLDTHPNKVSSAWTEVWTDTCCPKPTKSSIFCCKCWPSKHQLHSLVDIPTKTDEISYFITAATHKPWLDTIQHENRWSRYWISEYSFRYKPWCFVEVEGHRDFEIYDNIFTPVCLYHFPHQAQTQIASFSIASR